MAEALTGELRAYARRVGDRWALEQVLVAGPPYLVVLVSPGFDGVPWLERVRQAEALWDADEMGGPAEVHCYTPAEFERQGERFRDRDLSALPSSEEQA